MSLLAIFSTPQLLGTLEIGVLISTILFGVMIMQGHFYLTHCKNDSWILVSFVSFAFLITAFLNFQFYYLGVLCVVSSSSRLNLL